MSKLTIIRHGRKSKIKFIKKTEKASNLLDAEVSPFPIHMTTGPRYLTAVVQLKPLHCAHGRDGSRKVLVEAALAILRSSLWPHAGTLFRCLLGQGRHT